MHRLGINKVMLEFSTFLSFLEEQKSKSGGLHVFDVDETLFHTTAKVRVMRGDKHVESLSNSDYNTHELPDGHHYDFSEFRSAEKFAKESKPNARVLTKMKNLHSKAKEVGGKVIINTARADFDDKDKFLDKFRKHDVDIDDIHVHRAGNLKTKGTVAEKKTSIIRDQIQKGNYSHVSLYDDSEHNLKAFLGLKKEYPHIRFNAHHVKPDGKFKRYTG